MATIIQNKGELNAAIRNILHTGKALDAAIHQAAISCLWHAREYGDTGFFQRLVEAMPKGSRVKALTFWATEHSPLVLKKNGNWGVNAGAKAKAWKIQEAIAVPFWEFSKEKNPAPMTVEKLLGYLSKLADSTDDSKVDPKARELAAQLVALAA